jgi:hypothetical protein
VVGEEVGGGGSGYLDVREVRGGNGVSGRLCGRWRNEEEMGDL